MTEVLTVEQRVTNGVAWLDKNRPDWLEYVNERQLAMSSIYECIMGQLYGNWYESPMAIDTNSAYWHGFYAKDLEPGSGESHSDLMRRYRELTEAWCERIRSLCEERGLTTI